MLEKKEKEKFKLKLMGEEVKELSDLILMIFIAKRH